MKKNISIYVSPVSAGFPSPADDFVENTLDLNEYLVKHPSATFFARSEGDSMHDCGIFSGDIMVVDRSLEPKSGSVVVAILDGQFTVKRIVRQKDKIFLCPENQKYRPIKITLEMDFQVWGVVTYVIHGL